MEANIYTLYKDFKEYLAAKKILQLPDSVHDLTPRERTLLEQWHPQKGDSSDRLQIEALFLNDNEQEMLSMRQKVFDRKILKYLLYTFIKSPYLPQVPKGLEILLLKLRYEQIGDNELEAAVEAFLTGQHYFPMIPISLRKLVVSFFPGLIIKDTDEKFFDESVVHYLIDIADKYVEEKQSTKSAEDLLLIMGREQDIIARMTEETKEYLLTVYEKIFTKAPDVNIQSIQIYLQVLSDFPEEKVMDKIGDLVEKFPQHIISLSLDLFNKRLGSSSGYYLSVIVPVMYSVRRSPHQVISDIENVVTKEDDTGSIKAFLYLLFKGIEASWPTVAPSWFAEMIDTMIIHFEKQRQQRAYLILLAMLDVATGLLKSRLTENGQEVYRSTLSFITDKLLAESQRDLAIANKRAWEVLLSEFIQTEEYSDIDILA